MVAIIDYDAGNVRSLQFALERLGEKSLLTADFEEIKAADKVIFPGQGAAGSAMNKLKQTGLDQLIPQLTQPVLGICLGLQLMCKDTEEGNIKGLGIFDASVKKFPSIDKVPHMGWNNVDFQQEHFIFNNLKTSSDFYFLHGFCISRLSRNFTLGRSRHSNSFSSVIARENLIGVQFHPEKSQSSGLKMLENFVSA